MRSISAHLVGLVALVMSYGPSASAQNVPWDVFLDSLSNAACDVVNAGNLELVVLSDTGQLVVVTANDYLLDEAAFVDENSVFFFFGIPVGEILFANDGDGLRTVWLLAPDDTVLELDPITGAPVFTNLFPDDFVGVPCDAFELWDDSDFDDVSDEFDFCPETPLNEIADADGCSCSQLDSDDDGVDDCGDECPFTPANEFADDFGCSCSAYDDDVDGVDNCFDGCPNTRPGDVVDADGCPVVIIVRRPPPAVSFVCGNLSSLTLAMTLGTLGSFRLARRRFS